MVEEVVRIGKAALPYEACGVIYDRQVVQVPNRAEDPSQAYEIRGADIIEALHRYPDAVADGIIIWHTHPSGRIGPSQGDMATKVAGFKYLVVALPNGEAVFF